MASTQPPAQLEHVLQQLVNTLVDLNTVLSDQQKKPCHADTGQVTALDPPAPGNEAQGLTTTATTATATPTTPLETITAFCPASPADPTRSDEDAPAGDLTGATSDVAADIPVASEPPQADALVRLPRNLDEWIVSPLPNGIRLKVFQANDSNKANAFRSVLETWGEIPILLSYWDLWIHYFFGPMYANHYMRSVSKRVRLVDVPALEGKDTHALNVCVRSRLRSFCQTNVKTIHHGSRQLFLPDVGPSSSGGVCYSVHSSGRHLSLTPIDRGGTSLGKVWMVKSRVLMRSTLSIPELACLSSWLSPASSEQIVQIISSYVLPRPIAMHQRWLYSPSPRRPSTPAGPAPKSAKFVFDIRYWVPLLDFPDIKDQQPHEEGLLICRELGSVFGPHHLQDASDTNPIMYNLLLLLRLLYSIGLAKYSTLQGPPTTVKEKWKDLMSDGRRSTVLERRSTVVTTLNEVSPHSKYAIVILSDDKVEQDPSSEALDRLLSSSSRDGTGEPARPSGISHHLLLMHEIQDTLRLDNLMFDRSFKLSKKYFSVLQFLKLASKSVEEPASSFEASHRHFLELLVTSAAQNTHSDEWRGVKDGWDHVAASVGVATRRIQGRIEHLMEEVKTHQESMFNATSLRETNNGMALNRSVYVLTAVTILYAPVGFMATFWALPFLNGPAKDGHTKVPYAFRTSFIAIPLLTYLFSLSVSLFFGSSRFRKITSQAAQGYWAYYSELFAYYREIRQQMVLRVAVMFGLVPARADDITGTREDGPRTQLGSEGV
ncbi:hypothetical protein CTA2_10634 [Colletotrichum tanaceti]|uniref:Uncharacterized protein n=1 Tax=Colletotrichum tanaceti TaxID=1306861 RepID=A0A4U6XR46_9PEZI|nr:hypothetical protein CTA2_10634 [Colletotrichum tanaceti]TKW58363.1 hypothetical protein CTA1_5223 [Colletotrichum tanaceti]